MSPQRKGEWLVEDKARGLLDVCKHSGPACWPCVARDMERQRDEIRARHLLDVERLRTLLDRSLSWVGDGCQLSEDIHVELGLRIGPPDSTKEGK